ncbi:hypothetical protein N7532_002436 [Penicillium argentinense]|uniref:Uncharacterized protein n=1 Tax=Penicillium argentinense TaxID=1131581 RepID=A0A9W9G0I5_9EURO|nr:uncharacterized protein N7532_002436 [Penicillium argentinense]KAJ5109791.1 hypothetical protein N7532_002436 [Penicillium argentinense]
MAGNQSNRQQKRSRASDAAEKVSRSSDDRAKRRRTSEANEGPKEPKPFSNVVQEKQSDGASSDSVEKRSAAAPWSFSRPVGGRYSNLDPVVTEDEAYLFVGLDTAVQVFATSTSRLLRTLQMENGQKVIGYKLSPVDQGVLYIFTSGFVTKWDWNSGKRLVRWGTTYSSIAVDVQQSETAGQVASYSIGAQKDGKRQVIISALGDKKSTEIVALDTAEQVNSIQTACKGRVIVVSDGTRVFLGTTRSIDLENPESTQYMWREATFPVTATSLHLRENPDESKSGKGSEAVDLVIGEGSGSILIYHDLVNTLFSRNAEKKSPPRKLHWHRSAVSTVRWSKDGNYLISGGQESVLVLWQLDTGKKQFLPHLSSPICNLVVSPSGNSYVVKLADNSVMVLSARELQPSANVTGLQLAFDMASSKDPSSRKPSRAIATLHPQHPERMLIAVPASHQPNQLTPQRSSSAMLQTFDIRSNSHISRQALARTNTTTLNMTPDRSPITTPDVRHMEIVEDGKWLATVDTWAPQRQDLEATAANCSSSSAALLRPEIFLKFWKWNASSDMWELVTRIDAPHFTDNHHASILGLAPRPCSHEFTTLGEDAVLRFWCPTARHRGGLKTNPADQHQDTWKCRSMVDLTGCLDSSGQPLSMACMSFSEDGSVLAVCLSPGSGANDGLVLLIDARNGTVHYRRTGVFFGKPCSAKFLGRYLIVASTQSLAIWDTVDDVVKPLQLNESADTGYPPMVAVNARTKSFAIATRELDNTSAKRRRRSRFQIRIYDVPSFEVVFQETLGSYPVALLSDVYSGDYVVVDTSASVQRLGCLDKASQKSLQPHEVTSHLNSGLANIFKRGQETVATNPTDGESSTSSGKGLAGVFGDTPSFSLPSISVLFRNVVQSLGST